MKKILVTGGAGFIGSALVRHLTVSEDAEVVVLDKMTYSSSRESLTPALASGRARLEVQDICDGEALSRLFDVERPDTVFHLAAETHVDRSIGSPSPFIQTNIVGTFALLEAARGYHSHLDDATRAAFRIIHVSTDEVFGSLGSHGAFDETSPYDPSSPYAASKAASDLIVRAWHRTYGLPVIITNCSNNYGPYQFPEKLIPLMILKALERAALPVYGDGSNVRDWLHVDDHVRALCLIARRGRTGETYAIGARSERTNLDVVQTLCRHLDQLRPGGPPHSRLIELVKDRPGHDQRYAIDPSKLETQLGWHAAETFETGLEKTIAWYLANPDWWRPLRERVYRGERLGLVETVRK